MAAKQKLFHPRTHRKSLTQSSPLSNGEIPAKAKATLQKWHDLIVSGEIKEIQSFVGALAGQQASKGGFITTSGFKNTAIEYAKSVPQKVILIDGLRLSELMIECNIGVSTVRTVELKRLDSDYFED